MVSVKPISEKSKQQSLKSKSKKKKNSAFAKKKVSKIVEIVNENRSAKVSCQKINRSEVKYVMPSTSITENLVDSCLDALQKLAAHHSKKNAIFGFETSIFAEIRCMKIPNTRGNIKFILPHSTAASTGEICLITPDLKKGKKVDHEPTVEHWKDILKEAGVTEIKTVLPLRQLKVEYDQYELKRRLLTQHDFIMVDTRILNHASHLLGKMFFKKHNMLIPIKMNEEANIKKYIDIGLRTAMLRLNEGHTSTILVGHTSMPQNNLKENIMSLIKQLTSKYPGGEANIRSISLKLPLSLPLPLYLTLRSSNSVGLPKLAHKKPKHFTVLEDELSTIPDSTVRVAPDGTVHLKKQKYKTNKSVDKEDLLESEKEDESEGDINEEE
ncbi:unnamed protein product [Parnassius mnemosyne]|uniref:Ribosomal L1 domain-containing protein CG13096 n=1 Tax=Parnassius mnemosyne TaxID=213953 RepID=A0AAV1LPX6_9NEOP